MAAPLVSINMCTYNASRYVRETLDTVLAQTLGDFEVIIVDDGSTDGTPDLIACEYPDPRIIVVRQRHVTLRIARPLALAHSRGEFIAFLDSDDLWAPQKLERQVAAARAAPEAGLILCDSDLIDASGLFLGRFSDQFDYGRIDFRARAHMELLRRGNFIASPTPFVPATAIRTVGGFNHAYRHVSDYELWLRLARRYPFVFMDDSLARYRVHDAQFTQQRLEITLPEHRRLLEPIVRSSSYPQDVRTAVGDNLLGQHRMGWRAMLRKKRYRVAARTALGMLRYPGRIRDSARHRIATSPVGGAAESAIAGYHRGRAVVERGRASAHWVLATAAAHTANATRRAALRARRAPGRIARIVRGEPIVRRSVAPPQAPRPSPRTQIWIDGSALGRAQVGYFSLLCELIRRLVQHQSPVCAVHVLADASGRAALRARLGDDGATVRFHRIGWRTMHWSDIHRLLVGWRTQLLVAIGSASMVALAAATASRIIATLAALLLLAQTALLLDEIGAEWMAAVGRARQRYGARLVRYLWRRLPAPRRRAPAADTIEVLFWRGRFRWRNSRRIAIVQDMTTRVHPELHTAGNIEEFDEFLGYVQRHAHEVATVSRCSRQDIVDRIEVCPDSVSVIAMPVHPQYVRPQFSAGFVSLHRIAEPYVLCVGTLEPRKNLRRLVKAFDLLKEESAARGLTLALVGPQGWDDGFREFVSGLDVSTRVRLVGFVPLDHLPSLYHYASAVIYPSLYEGFGIPVLEAMCCSSLVLASDISALPEVLGDAGIRFDPNQTESIAGALLRALTLAPVDAAHYRRRCRRRAEAHLDRLAQEAPLPGLGQGSALKLA